MNSLIEGLAKTMFDDKFHPVTFDQCSDGLKQHYFDLAKAAILYLMENGNLTIKVIDTNA